MTTDNLYRKENTDEISLIELIRKFKSLLRYLLSKWIFILLSTVFGALIGYGYGFIKKTTYVANTLFVLEEESKGGGLSSLSGLASIAGVDIGGGGSGIFQGDNILELYKSRSMIENTLLTNVPDNGQDKLLIDYYIDFNKLKELWSKDPNLLKLQLDKTNNAIWKNGNRASDSVMGVIVNDIKKNYLKVVRPDKKLSYINAQVSSTNEFFAKIFNEEIVKNVNDFYTRTKTKKSQQNIQLLQTKVDSVRNIMNRNIFSAASINDATPNLNPTKQVQRIVPVQRSQISVETSKAVLGTLIQNLEMAKYAQSKEAPLIQIVDSPVFPLEKERLSKLLSLIVGGFIFGLFAVTYLIMKRLLSKV